jgi:hypothetical protein
VDLVEQLFGHGGDPHDLVFGCIRGDQVGVVLRR